MLYDKVPDAVLNAELTRDYLAYDSDEWRRRVAEA